jgi:ribonuclease HI
LAALAGALETLPSGSRLDVYTRLEYVLTVANNLEQWKSRGWELSERPAKNSDILQRIWEVLTKRKIELHVHHVPKGEQPHDSIIEELNLLARSKWRNAS